ncbi:hypothetical protein [Oscillatoria sp. HE19RPO]|nr:hypothetical protein [Oscillatoria sp. HE19RPO]
MTNGREVGEKRSPGGGGAIAVWENDSVRNQLGSYSQLIGLELIPS